MAREEIQNPLKDEKPARKAEPGPTSLQHSAFISALINGLVLLLEPRRFPAVTGEMDFSDWQTKARRRSETANAIKDTFAASPPRASSVRSTLLA